MNEITDINERLERALYLMEKRREFLARMYEQNPIRPGRYVWHLSHSSYDETPRLRSFSIATRGLKSEYSKYGAVFANNRLDSIQSFFPYIWDVEEYLHKFVPVNDLTPSDEVGWVDFWRIDTRACKVTWYIDPNMINDRIFGHGNELPENYICTPHDIPPQALMLFRFRYELYDRHWKKALLTKSPRFPISLLRPCERVNEWVARSAKAA